MSQPTHHFPVTSDAASAGRIYRIPPGALLGYGETLSLPETVNRFLSIGCATEFHFAPTLFPECVIALAASQPGHSLHLPSGQQGHRSLEVARVAASANIGMVMHPTDILEADMEFWQGVSRTGCLLIENMDTVRSMGQTPEDMLPLFECLPDAQFCFDMAHAREVDPSMSLAHELMDALGSRLVQFHASTVHPGGVHDTLTAEVLDDFLPFLESHPDIPVVLETFEDNLETLREQIALLQDADARLARGPSEFVVD